MAIITKPSIAKGQAATFTLSKSELLQHPMVVADSYFSDSANWYRVNAVYKSSPGSQYEIVEFDASLATPTGSFLVSNQARDLFQIQKLVILDFDGGFLEIPRSELVSSQFDISFVQAFFTVDFSQSITQLTPQFLNGCSVVDGVLNMTNNGSNFSFLLPSATFPTSGTSKYVLKLYLDSSYPHSTMEGGVVYPLIAYKTFDPLKWATFDTTQPKLDTGFIVSVNPINEDLYAGNRVRFMTTYGGFKITKIEFFQA